MQQSHKHVKLRKGSNEGGGRTVPVEPRGEVADIIFRGQGDDAVDLMKRARVGQIVRRVARDELGVEG